jgi:hypothetical protein
MVIQVLLEQLDHKGQQALLGPLVQQDRKGQQGRRVTREQLAHRDQQATRGQLDRKARKVLRVRQEPLGPPGPLVLQEPREASAHRGRLVLLVQPAHKAQPPR